MARESFRSLYGDLTKLKDDSLLKDPAAGSDDDDELFQLLLAVSDWVDHWCNRHFYMRIETLFFDGTGDKQLLVPDLVSEGTLKEDTAEDLSYETTWEVSDYFMLPYVASAAHWTHPFNRIRVRSKGEQSVF
ncbi:MAG: hypothetical protein V3S68_01595, partial [Dehalococcoidia bacterium]